MQQINKQSTRSIERLAKQQKKLSNISRLLDNAFTIPILKIRLGWDAIIGLIPVVGDIAGAIISLYLVLQAIRMGLPFTKIVRMLANIGIELLIGMIPVLGDLFDIGWKANLKNYQLIDQHINTQLLQLDPEYKVNETSSTRKTRLFSFPLVLAFLLCLAVAYFGYPFIIDLKSQCANGLVIWGIALC